MRIRFKLKSGTARQRTSTHHPLTEGSLQMQDVYLTEVEHITVKGRMPPYTHSYIINKSGGCYFKNAKNNWKASIF